MSMKETAAACLLLAALFSPSTLPGAPAQYEFNGNLASAVGGAALTTGFAAPALSANVTFTTATIGGQSAQVASFTRGTFFSLTHGLGANGGGSKLNQYTLIFDVMFPSRPSGWAVLYQSNTANNDDGEWFVNPSQGLGISGAFCIKDYKFLSLFFIRY